MDNQQLIDLCYGDIFKLVDICYRNKLSKLNNKNIKTEIRTKIHERSHMSHLIQGHCHVDDLAEASLRKFEDASDEGRGGNIFEGVTYIVADRSGYWDKVIDNSKNTDMGIDLELHKQTDHLTICVHESKSSKVWGNGDQWKTLKRKMSQAETLLLSQYPDADISFSLGLCGTEKPNGKPRRRKGQTHDIHIRCGANLWTFLTDLDHIKPCIMQAIYQAGRESYDQFEKDIKEARQSYLEAYKEVILEFVPTGKEAKALQYLMGAIPCEGK